MMLSVFAEPAFFPIAIFVPGLAASGAVPPSHIFIPELKIIL